MCFKSKVKTPKQDPNAIIAPAPVPLEEPKGVEFGADADADSAPKDGVDGLTVTKDTKDTGDGSTTATVKAPASVVKKSGNPSIKRALQTRKQ